MIVDNEATRASASVPAMPPICSVEPFGKMVSVQTKDAVLSE